MASTGRYAGQIVAYALFFLPIAWFSNQPTYQHLAPDQATITLSLRHSGQLLGECRVRSTEEMANMPATMRVEQDCPRERSPLVLALEVDGKEVIHEVLPPRGLHADGMAAVYRRLAVPAGEVRVAVRMKDHIDQAEFPYRGEHMVKLEPAQVLVIDFNSQTGDFTFL